MIGEPESHGWQAYVNGIYLAPNIDSQIAYISLEQNILGGQEDEVLANHSIHIYCDTIFNGAGLLRARLYVVYELTISSAGKKPNARGACASTSRIQLGRLFTPLQHHHH